MKTRNLICIVVLVIFGLQTISAQITQGGDCDDGNQCIDATPGSTWYWRDADGDGVGTNSTGTCSTSSTPPSGYSTTCHDCNDNNENIQGPIAWYYDGDNDGLGAGTPTMACTRPNSQYEDNNDDCDDTDNSIRGPKTWYHDYDGDTFGDPYDTIEACEQPIDYVGNNNDCNDNDEDTTLNVYYADKDGDTFGDPNDTILSCTLPSSGYTNNSLDCNDNASFINPNTKWYPDNDGDNYPNRSLAYITQCEQPTGYAYRFNDCNDNDAAINPQTTWYIDNDGDGYGDTKEGAIKSCTQPANHVLVMGLPEAIPENPLPDLTGLDTEDMNMTHSIEPYDPVSTLAELDALNKARKQQAKTYYDGLGRPVQEVAMYAGGLTEIGIEEEDYASGWVNDWTVGQGSTNFYGKYGDLDENNRIIATGPYENDVLVWECSNNSANNGQDGGFTSDPVAIENNKTYIYKTWVKRFGSATDGRILHGGTNLVKLNTNTIIGGAYFTNGQDLPNTDEWYLVVGVIHPNGYNGGETGLSGIYNTDGIKVEDALEFKWQPSTNSTIFRNYMFLANQTTTRQQFYKPTLQKIEDTNISIENLLDVSTGNDIVNYIEYDRFGRTTKGYLPYGNTENPSGDFQIEAKDHLVAFYASGTLKNSFAQANNPFSETVFERSPRSRALVQGSSADNWQIGTGHEVTMDYKLNTGMEIRHYGVNLDANLQPTIVMHGNYSSSQLTKSIVRDENWISGVNNTAEEFKNEEGLTVLKRTYVNGTTLSTYYVYDDYNNLTYILPPKAEPHSATMTITILNELCFQFKYDHLRRQIEKRNPGVGGWEKIVYDHEDRPILVQDANMETSNEWLFTKYDKFGRALYTGKYTTTQTRSQLQETANDWVAVDELSHNESRTSGTTIDGVFIKYSNAAFPNTNLELLTVNYYDDYNVNDPDMPILPATILEQPITTNTKGLATVAWVKVLGESAWAKSYTFYDEKARAISVYSKNHHGGFTAVESLIDFRGKVLKTITRHKKQMTGSQVSLEDHFNYDHMERIHSQRQKVYNGDTDQDPKSDKIVSGFVYDALGQLMVKYIEPENNAFGWHLAPSQNKTSGSKTTFIKGTAGSWSAATNSSSVSISKQQMEVGCLNHLDGALGYYNMKAGDTYDIEFDIDIKNFTGDVELTVAYRSDQIYYSRITSSGTIVATVIPTVTGTHTIGLKLYDPGKSYKASQFFTVDNIVVAVTDDTPPEMSLQLISVNALQSINYKYNTRGSLTDINNVNSMGNDLFAYKINYDTATLNNGAIPMYNGNIAETLWKTQNDNVLRGYAYQYDALSRLKEARHSSSNYNLNTVSYDKNGNILSLNRNRGATNTDDFSYTYDIGNKLMSLSGSKTSNYTYDVNGNMLTDASKSISNTPIIYNHLDLPELVIFDNGDAIEYVYDATGMKLEKRVTQSGVTTVTDYLDGFQYQQDQLQFFPQSEGYVVVNNRGFDDVSFDYVYNYSDHLGNVRLTYADSDGNGSIDASTEIIEEKNYYPFGGIQKGYNNVINGTAHPYGFGGKEENKELGLDWHDFGARNYDASLGRWMNIDPLAELMESESPFNYALNNPIYYRDADGRAPKGMLDPYLIFNGKDNKIYIYDDNDTPDDKSDDVLLGTFDAHNNVSSKSKGKWENGTYDMFDKTGRRTRGSMETVNLPLFNYYVHLNLDLADVYRFSHNRRGRRSVRVKQDSDYGRYGNGGIYRAASFTQSDGQNRAGMAVHSGRLHKSFSSRVTYGCIRTTCDAMTAIDNAIQQYGPLTTITVEDNLSPVNPQVTPVNNLTPAPITPIPTPLPSGGTINPAPTPNPSPTPSPSPPPIVPPTPRPDSGNGF